MYLHFKPICKCGHIFSKIRIREGVPVSIICPRCGQEFNGISFHVPVDGVFNYDEDKDKKEK